MNKDQYTIKTTLYVIIAGLICIFYGCNFFDNVDPIPSYLIIEDATVRASLDQGGNTDNIKDVWVFFNGRGAGVWELPAKIPFTETGDVDIILLAGIRVNGIAEIARIYPFYDSYQVNQTITQGSEVRLDPVFPYSENTNFSFVETFENRNIFSVDINGNTNPMISRTDDSAAEGTWSALVQLNDSMDVFEVKSQFNYETAQILGSDVYLELDYKGDLPFLVGYAIQGAPAAAAGWKLIVNPSDAWNKIYIELSDELLGSGGETFQIRFGGGLEGDEDRMGSFQIDNVKVVHF